MVGVLHLTPGQQPGTPADRLLHQAIHPGRGLGGHQRPDLGAVHPGVPHRPAPGLGECPLDEGVVDRLLDQDPAHRVAALAGVLERAEHRLLGGEVEVGVGEDDGGGVPAQLEVQRLRSGLGGDAAAHRARAGERDHRDIGVGRQHVADLPAPAGHDVEHARWEAGLLQDAAEEHQGDRGVGGRLGHDGVPGGDGRDDLGGGEEQRVVERAEGGHGAHRLAQHDGGAPGRVRDPVAGEVLAEDLAHLLADQAESLAGGLHLGCRLLGGLAQVGHDGVDEGLPVLLQDLGRVLADLQASGRGQASEALAGVAGGGDGRFDVLARGLGGTGDHRPVDGGADVEPLPGRSGLPLAADEQLGRGDVVDQGDRAVEEVGGIEAHPASDLHVHRTTSPICRHPAGTRSLTRSRSPQSFPVRHHAQPVVPPQRPAFSLYRSHGEPADGPLEVPAITPHQLGGAEMSSLARRPPGRGALGRRATSTTSGTSTATSSLSRDRAAGVVGAGTDTSGRSSW